VPQLASQMTVSGADVNARPMTRPGEVVEVAPLMAIEHSDGGKANVYYLRGWDLEHGTDLATFVDDVPINLPTHVHGQGYTDLNWLIPETVGGVELRKGPFFADVGDFANAGDLHISFRDGPNLHRSQTELRSFLLVALRSSLSQRCGQNRRPSKEHSRPHSLRRSPMTMSGWAAAHRPSLRWTK
jgi:hypothetical protein